MRFQLMNRFVNPVVRGLLGSRLHGLLSGSLAVLTYTGRSSGQRRSLPVMYAERNGELIVFAERPAEKRWWRNLRGGAPVTVLVRGRRLEGYGEVLSEDGSNVADAVAVYATKFPKAGAHLRAGEKAVLVRIRLSEGRRSRA